MVSVFGQMLPSAHWPTNTECLQVGGGETFVGIGPEEINAKDDAAHQFLLARGSTTLSALDPTDAIPSATGHAPPARSTSNPSDRADHTSAMRRVTPLSDELMDWQRTGQTVTPSRQVDLRSGEDHNTERSVAVQVLESLRDSSEPKIPAFLANPLNKALVMNTVASALPASHPYFRKAWDLSQTSLSACHTLIGRWKMAHQGSSNTPALIMDTKTLSNISFDDEFALMDESGELGL